VGGQNNFEREKTLILRLDRGMKMNLGKKNLSTTFQPLTILHVAAAALFLT
jgi:hypothetical protein